MRRIKLAIMRRLHDSIIYDLRWHSWNKMRLMYLSGRIYRKVQTGRVCRLQTIPETYLEYTSVPRLCDCLMIV